MSQQQRQKIKLEPKMESVIQVKLPMVRDYSTGGGHAPGDTLVEGDAKIVTKKWQGYAPTNLNVVGKPMPPLPEVAIPRFTGKAEYTTRVSFPNQLYARFLTTPHVHSRIRNIDTSEAEKMPGVKYVLTYKNSPMSYPLPQELNFQGEIVAIVAAETEDMAEDAVEAIKVDYDVLPTTATVKDALTPNTPDLRQGKGNLILINPNNQHYDPKATWVARLGDVNNGFAQADIVKEFTYYFGGATAVPIQPVSCLAKWDGDKLTCWGHGQGIYPVRSQIARALAIEETNIRYINKYNGCTFGSTNANSRIYPWIAYISKQVGRPVKTMLPKDQELALITVKPENIVKFKVGAMKDGKIIALHHEMHISMGDQDAAGHSSAEISKNALELYTIHVPNWESLWYSYKTNTIRAGICRSYTQQETKWSWENMIDEMAEAVGKDPVEFRLMHIPRPGDKLTKAWHEDLGNRFEAEGGAVHFDSYASVEVLQEGMKAIEWQRRNSKPGANPGRFKRGIGVAMSQHHPGHMGYHDQETYFEKVEVNNGGGQGTFGSQVDIRPDGTVLMRNAMPESGTNHDTALAHLVAEMLGFTSRDPVHVVWGDSDVGPPSSTWVAGKTITLQGAAVCSATDKLRRDLLRRASNLLKVETAKLQIRDGVISSTEDPKKRTTFAELVRLNKGVISQQGRGINKDQGRALTKGIAATFVEVEVDTWTGDWKFIRAAYSHDVGLVVNPLVGEADMHGSLIEAFQMTTDPLPYDRELPGTRHYSVGYLSYRLPTIMDIPEQQTNIFIDSLEPRWFFGAKSFSETAIGSVPGAIANAIYNACGVRVREHPVTKDKIMAGLATIKANGGRA
jgi:CO/xanthine dehydrogenase Mo-binding subunit